MTSATEKATPSAATIQANRILRIDAIEGLKRLPSESVDLIVTDPPYNIASKSKIMILQGKVRSTAEAFGHFDTYHSFDFDNLIRQLISEAWRVLKRGGAMYMFTARETNARFIDLASQRGFTYRNVIALTKNPGPSIYKNAWRSGFDLCLFMTKGKIGTFNFLGQSEMSNVYKYCPRNKQTKHPTEKPIELIEKLIKVSSKPGDLVVDPFMGSGTTAVAAKNLGRRYLGCELHTPYLNMARQRIRIATSGGEGGSEKDDDSQESTAPAGSKPDSSRS